MEVTFSEGGRYKFACYRLTKASTGWISPYCDTCAGKISHAERFIPIEEWLSGSGDEVASERIVNEKDTHSL